jgi:hypothetical protein
MAMATLTESERDQLQPNDFAYIDKEGERHLPIHDAAHVRNAIARFSQTHFESKAARERARKKVLAAARRLDVEVDSDDAIMRHA